MFEWYFKSYFIDNKPVFWVSVSVILIIIILTAIFVYKELRKNQDANK